MAFSKKTQKTFWIIVTGMVAVSMILSLFSMQY